MIDGRIATYKVPRMSGMTPYHRLEAAFADRDAPFAFVDLDAMWSNAHEMLGRAGPKPIRVASKSVRCRELLERIAAHDPRFRGLMTFTLAETLWLRSLGFDDLLLAYPTADAGALAQLGSLEGDGRPIVMMDSPEHLDLIERTVPSPAAPVRVCLDMDAGFHMAGGRVKIGPKRSAVRTPPQAEALAREVLAARASSWQG